MPLGEQDQDPLHLLRGTNMILFIVLFGGFIAWGIWEHVSSPKVLKLRAMTDEEAKKFHEQWKGQWFYNRSIARPLTMDVLDFTEPNAPPGIR